MPSVTTRPRSTTTARSHRSSTRSSWCDENSTVAPRRASPTSTLDRASTATGSSRRTARRGRARRAGGAGRRSAGRAAGCRARGPRARRRPGRRGRAASSQRVGLAVGVGPRHARAAGRGSAAARRPSSSGTGRAPRAGSRSAGGRPGSIGWPSKRTAPASSAVSPKTARIVVVLPAPLGPRNPVTEPGSHGERHPVEGA